MNSSRRQFLQRSASALSLPLLTSLNDRPLGTRADRPLRVAIMGLGSYGTRVAERSLDITGLMCPMTWVRAGIVRR